MKGQGQTIAALGSDTGHNCPAPELFPGCANAIREAKTVDALAYAVKRYAFAAMWARHETGRGSDLARDVVIHTIMSHARQSPVRPRMPVRFVSRAVANMDEAARKFVEGCSS